jgi:peptidoglycan/xylan/chitin deacetylase (PgdA/CDA1 family)
MKKPFNSVQVISIWLFSFAVLALLLLMPAWWPLLLPIHLLSQGFVVYPNIRPNCDWFGPVIKSFQTNRREIWLTIDDGPHHTNTPKILELLRRFEARATFFVIGERVRAHPQLARSILEQGHSLGNHSATHPKALFWGFWKRAAAREIDGGTAAVLEVTGTLPNWFRAPVGMANFFVHQIIRERRMKLIGWSARGFDAVKRDVATVVEKILSDIRPGAIVLLHENGSAENQPSVSVLAIETLLERLQAEGYTCVVPEDHQLSAR